MGTLKVGNYELVKLLGEGGMGSVYEAHHLETKQRVAVKLINADVAAHSTVLARFELEARAAAAIQSPFVAKVLDFGRVDGAPFLVMELLEGKDLETVFSEHRILPQELVTRFASQCCLGLQKAHERGIVHRDIKPANLILAEQPDSKDLVLKILDFGIAKVRADEWQALSDEPLTRTGSLLGSPRYMSPEQARGYKNIDQRTDLFSLAVVMYQALTGHTPHHQIEAMGDLIVTLCSDPSPPMRLKSPWIDPKLERIVARALAIAVGDRYASAAEMAKDLAELVPEAPGIPRGLVRTFEPPVANTLPNAGALPKVPDAVEANTNGSSGAKDPIPVTPLVTHATTTTGVARPTENTPKAPRPIPKDLGDGSDAFPLPWVAAGIMLSLVIGIGSVAAGVIPLPAPSRSASAPDGSAAPSAPTASPAPTSSPPPSAKASSETPSAPASAPSAPTSSAAPTTAPTIAPSASARPALTGHLPPPASAPPVQTSVPKVPSTPPQTPPQTPPGSPFPTDSPL